jgi:ABC-type proline/glycine betaine transport system permease subunit
LGNGQHLELVVLAMVIAALIASFIYVLRSKGR